MESPTNDQRAAAIAEGIITTARNASLAVRLALLRLPDATIDIREKDVRGAWRTVMTVTARKDAQDMAYSHLGDLIYELGREPYSLSAHRDGPLRIRVHL